MSIYPFLVSQYEVAKLDKITEPEFLVKKVQNVEYTMDNYGWAWRFHPQGLFSENIFGCVIDYTCACPKTWTVEQAQKEKVCPYCGAKLTLSKARKVISAAIELPVTIINPLIALQSQKTLTVLDNRHFLTFVYTDRKAKEEHKPHTVKLLSSPELAQHIKHDIPVQVMHPVLVIVLLKWLFEERTDLLTKTTEEIDNMQDSEILDYDALIKRVPTYAQDNIKFKEQKNKHTIEEIKLALKTLIDYYKSLSKQTQDRLVNYIKLPIDFIVYRYVEVIPPDYRTIVFDGKLYHVATDQVNTELWPILRIRKAKELDPISTDVQFDYYDTYTEIVLHVHRYYQILFDKISKKGQIIRGHKLGKRIDLSARAVLVGNPTLEPDEVILPYLFAIMLYYPYILRRYAEKYDLDYTTADQELQDMVELRYVTDKAKIVIDEFTQDNKDRLYVVIMRQPVLHIPSLNVFKVADWSDDIVIQMNQMLWPGYNADADGDSVIGKVKLHVFDKQKKQLRTVVLDLA